MQTFRVLTVSIIILVLFNGIAHATPSIQIWIPSTDIQSFKKVHFGLDTYIKTQGQDGTTEPTVTNVGLTVGILPFEKIQMEFGIDYRDTGSNHIYPFLFNAKLEYQRMSY